MCGFKPTCSISTLYCLCLTLTHVSRSNTDWRASLMSCAMICESRRRSWTRPIIQCSCQLKPRAERRDESTVEMPGREELFSLFFQCTNQPTHKHNWRNGYFSERKETWTSTLMLEDQFSHIRFAKHNKQHYWSIQQSDNESVHTELQAKFSQNRNNSHKILQINFLDMMWSEINDWNE